MVLQDSRDSADTTWAEPMVVRCHWMLQNWFYSWGRKLAHPLYNRSTMEPALIYNETHIDLQWNTDRSTMEHRSTTDPVSLGGPVAKGITASNWWAGIVFWTEFKSRVQLQVFDFLKNNYKHPPKMDKLKRASNYQLLFLENVHKLSVSKSGFTINYVTSPTPPPNTHTHKKKHHPLSNIHNSAKPSHR